MGVETCAKLLGHIEPEQILHYIKNNFDSNVKLENYTLKINKKISEYEWVKEIYGKSKFIKDSLYCIIFEYKDEKRALRYYYSNINSWENIEYYEPLGLESMVKSETTDIRLGCYGNSVEIIKSITSYFGGWVDENDCDDEPYYYIPPNPELNKNQPKILHLTKQEICDKFNVDYIIIDDD